VASVEPKVIRDLLDQVDGLKKDIEMAGVEGRTRLQEIRVDQLRTEVVGPTGKLDDAVWSKRPEDEQVILRHRLVQVRDSLRVAAGIDGPTDPSHIMYGEYASSRAVVQATVVSFALVGALLFTIVLTWDIATGTDRGKYLDAAREAIAQLQTARTNVAAAMNPSTDGPPVMDSILADSLTKARENLAAAERRVVGTSERAYYATGADERMILMMVTMLGALGGSLHLVGSLVKYIGNRQLKRSWLLYYLSLPLAGAALAPIVYMLLRVGILTPSGTAGGRSVTADLNLIGIYAFAAMTGMFAKIATDKLSEVFSTIFRPPPERGTRDGLTPERPGGG